MSNADHQRDACHCCEGIRSLTPEDHANRPGLPVLAYRVGTHGSFKATMLARLSRMPALGALGTRADDDLTIALLDAWATVADVMTFYIARNANEGFVRTATEDRSVQELARSIGYAPHPGVAASTYLAFTVEDGPGAAEDVPIPAGTRAQSTPGGDERPQTFETIEELAVASRVECPSAAADRTATHQRNDARRLPRGDGYRTQTRETGCCCARARTSDPANPGVTRNVPLQVIKVDRDQERQHTRVEMVRPNAPITPPEANKVALASNPPPPTTYVGPLVLSGTNASALANEFTWSSDDTQLFAKMQFLSEATLAQYVNNFAATPKTIPGTGLFAMRVQTAPFGHNAPKYTTLPTAWINLAGGDEPLNDELNKPYPFDWDAGSPSVNFASNDITYKTIYGEQGDVILLESAFPDVRTGSWILLKSSAEGGDIAAFRVVKAEQVSRADYALTAKATRLTLEEDDEQPDFNRFKLRTTAIYAQSEDLKLAGKPIDTAVQGDAIELDHMLERQIRPGRPVIVSGTPTDLEDVVESELAIVKEAVNIAGHTHLVLESKLQRAYRRGSVTVKANLVPATHGESHKEVLGGGVASQPFQAFSLGHTPLTYLVAPVPGGARSSLELRVSGVLWKEAASFFGLGPDDRVYVLRRDDEDKTTVAFGDGRSGGRLPTGFENVSARYRSGLGLAGNLAAGRIALLGSQPRFVRAVINPVPASGGAAPESSIDTRRNAPGSVRTFGRIVSLPDFEDFARAFAGVAKAQASLLQIGEARVVHVTIAGADGAPVSPESALYRDLLSAVDSVRDRFQRLLVASHENRFFDVTAKVRVHPDYQADTVMAGVEDALRATFSFERRDLAQGVTLSEVMATMQGVGGVEAIDLDAFHFSHERGLQAGKKIVTKGLSKVPARLSALRARRDASGRVLPAQHLSVYGIKLVEMT